MNQGVEILLARIDSNPEEFLLSSRKWGWLGVDGVKPPYLTAAEWTALQVKVQTIRANEFTERVMETLLQEEAGTAHAGLSTTASSDYRTTAGQYLPGSPGSPPLLGDPLRPMTFGPRR
jgi:hypothetical protein